MAVETTTASLMCTGQRARAAVDEIHAWVIPLRLPDRLSFATETTLSCDEHQRANRFRFPRDRDRYVAARFLLRQILSQYVATPPRELRFVYGAAGKPALQYSDIHFNLSHTASTGLVLVSGRSPVGVDVEAIRHDFAPEELAKSVFSAREQDELLSLPAHDRAAAFFRGWTRKEAYMKARGEGLLMDSSSFDVTLAERSSWALVATRPDPQEASSWTVLDLAVGAAYAAAAAIQGSAPAIRFRHWCETV